MGEDRTKNKSPARACGDSSLTNTPCLVTPSTVNVSEPAFACQGNLRKKCKIFTKNVTNNFKNSVTRDDSDGYKYGIWQLIPNRELLEHFLNDVLRIDEVKKRVPDKDTYVDTIFVDRSGENKKDRKSKRRKKPIRRLIKVNRASDLIDYWLSMISQNPELLFWSFYITPFLIVHDPEAPNLFEEEFYIYDEATGRSIKLKLRARYFVSCLALDVDDVSREEIIARIERVPVKPSYIVWSGTGAHLYFLFDQPYEETVKFEGFKPTANKLADIFGADSGAGYYKRYMRTLPYTRNSKYFPKKVIALLKKMPCLTLYLPDEIDLLVKRYFKSDDEPQVPPSLIPNLETRTHSAKNRDEQYRKLESKYRGLMRRSPRFYDIMTGKAPKIRKAKSASERVFIAALEFAAHGFPKWFAKAKLANWDFGLINGNRANEMRKYPERHTTRLKLIVNKAYRVSAPENYVLAVMGKGKGYSLERLCRLTGFNIAKLKHYVRILREQGKLEVKSSYRNGKLAMICRKPLIINASEKIREQIHKGDFSCGEKICVFKGEKIHAHLENSIKNDSAKVYSDPNKVYLDRDKVYLDPTKVYLDLKMVRSDQIKNTELVSELKKLEGRKKSEIKALYWELPKSNPLIAEFEKRVSELGVTGLEKDEAFALWVLQEKAKLNQKSKFHTGFT